MAEVSAPRGVNSAGRTTMARVADNPIRTIASLSFQVLLRGPAAAGIQALGPAPHAHAPMIPQTTPEVPPQTPHRHARRDSEPVLDPEAKPASEGPLDPLFCQLAVNHGLSSFVQPNPAAPVAPTALPLRDDLQNLLTGLARRAAWGGDRRKGSARIELSEGALAGATLVVHTDQRSVSVELELPPGTAAQGWQQRIAQRLEGRGFAARVKVG